jgi:hypothetical protein
VKAHNEVTEAHYGTGDPHQPAAISIDFSFQIPLSQKVLVLKMTERCKEMRLLDGFMLFNNWGLNKR